ncbi:PLDc N-terminal domain-containing protein [Helcococcus kunzii]|uniref:Cardiolipin synthase N-terminal domain-containing protein n=1 Tax=Helcococcus kunzii ATCC 51366 TaxID=883114 RepID=H3NL76_9FIRM|nr:PLDc N-terminal domain-containing protein [Helcococcus kunzii]EHR36057.1 hypothetical protein HMPREF9709_00153 [Helcococcus kunzii ATCC 51366]MCT1796640.1 PLDc N-terminal domain-containing protein [Helcococcus kunzii]MCT1988716.1 PLDc N-terminal domain-containing protein [Helcococcus kunzii]QUY64100.1 hypothetical protein GUI37_00640 [Helcococcus kunzii]QZO76553.1 PLDc N-terminal domain-containing protein [Helcococcus kunzii]
MEFLKEYLPIILPIILLEVILMFIALRDVLKRENYKYGNKTIWIFVVVFIMIFGPILYLTTAREE